LLRREAIDIRRTRLALKRFHERVVRDVKSSKVGDRLAGNELALQIQAGLSFKSTELLNNALSTRIEIFLVSLCPPVLQVTLRVEFSARIVIAVCYLMTDNRADRSIVERRIPAGNEMSLFSGL